MIAIPNQLCAKCAAPFVPIKCTKCNGERKIDVPHPISGRTFRIDCDVCGGRVSINRPSCLCPDPYSSQSADEPLTKEEHDKQQEAETNIRREWSFDNGCPE